MSTNIQTVDVLWIVISSTCWYLVYSEEFFIQLDYLSKSWIAVLPWQIGHGQTEMICSEGFTFGIWAVVVPLPKWDSENWKAEGVQWQYQYDSISLAVEHL